MAATARDSACVEGGTARGFQDRRDVGAPGVDAPTIAPDDRVRRYAEGVMPTTRRNVVVK